MIDTKKLKNKEDTSWRENIELAASMMVFFSKIYDECIMDGEIYTRCYIDCDNGKRLCTYYKKPTELH